MKMGKDPKKDFPTSRLQGGLLQPIGKSALNTTSCLR
jgi:hypothetical protein